MDNLKKVGLTALAGSLAAFSANAAEMSVSGATLLTYTSEDESEATGNPFGMKTNLSFTASGDVNGYTVSYMQTSQDQFAGMGRTGASPQAQAAVANQFSRAYVPTALQFREAELGRQQQANALGQAQQLQAAGMLPGIQQAMDQRAMMGTNLLGNVGQQREGYAGQYLQEDLQRYQFEQMAPYQRLQQYAGTILPIAGQFPMTTMTQPVPRYNALTGALGGAMSGAAMFPGNPMMGAMGGAALGFFSDRRLKESYRVVGKSPSGINIYQFKYKGSDDIYEGVMADEVPYAAYENEHGYDLVDYSKIDVEFRRIA